MGEPNDSALLFFPPAKSGHSPGRRKPTSTVAEPGRWKMIGLLGKDKPPGYWEPRRFLQSECAEMWLYGSGDAFPHGLVGPMEQLLGLPPADTGVGDGDAVLQLGKVFTEALVALV